MKARVAAVTAVAATYAYFLLFAQFGFLKALEAATGGQAAAIKSVMTVMGVAGISGSVLAARLFSRVRSQIILAGGFAICAGAAGLTLVGRSGEVFLVASLLVGLGTGVTTVTLAGVLRPVLGRQHLGLLIGLGTGLAYGFCNLPAIFNAAPDTQAVLALWIVGVGGLATAGLKIRAAEVRPVEFDYSKTGIATWVVFFFTLVGLDSAAFYVIQHTPVLKGETWNGEWRLQVNAGMHLVAALAAGWALDRQWLSRTSLAAAICLVTACFLIGLGRDQMVSGVALYTAGVSLYSVALVYYPVRSLQPGLAALVYAVAGWGGSALGIGFADHLHALPQGLIITAAVILVGALVVRSGLARRPVVPLLVGLGLFGAFVPGPRAEAQDRQLVAQGRQVFISEGCVHCHSQYVRPSTLDEARWGPAQPLDVLLAARPPLLGNRRQGPDLQNVGNRRNAEWNRLHLVAPRAITPGSRMPSYEHLFRPGRTEGTALLAYLDSLGAATFFEHSEEGQSWLPAEGTQVFPLARQRQLFGEWCAGCHGTGARGDGPVAVRLSVPPRNLVEDTWRHIPAGSDPVAERLGLARLIKFGVPGTAMAGREYLDDESVLSLAAYLQTLRAKK